MHSNRTLIRSYKDVEKTLERIEDAQKIIANAEDIPLMNIREMYWKRINDSHGFGLYLAALSG